MIFSIEKIFQASEENYFEIFRNVFNFCFCPKFEENLQKFEMFLIFFPLIKFKKFCKLLLESEAKFPFFLKIPIDIPSGRLHATNILEFLLREMG